MNDLNHDKIAAMLSYIDVESRDEWILAGMAIKDHDSGMYDVWNDWARQSKRHNENAARASWRSFRGGGITIGSLIHIARERGWRGRVEAVTQRRSEPRKVDDTREADAMAAAKLARSIIQKSYTGKFEYLESKGLDYSAMLYKDDGVETMIVPMRIDGEVVGLQKISTNGAKKFLFGQKVSEATHVIGNGALDVFCEGYATGLSAYSIISKIKPCTVHVCFSANNLIKVAQKINQGLVLADNDASETGLKAAQKIGLPYFMSDKVGNDFNDDWRENSFQIEMKLRKFLHSLKK